MAEVVEFEAVVTEMSDAITDIAGDIDELIAAQTPGGLSAVDGLTGGNKLGGWLGNIGRGAALGTKLGSFVPGIGNAVGAGIGAAGGAIKKLFGF